jgi:hypothetical protein
MLPETAFVFFLGDNGGFAAGDDAEQDVEDTLLEIMLLLLVLLFVSPLELFSSSDGLYKGGLKLLDANISGHFHGLR